MKPLLAAAAIALLIAATTASALAATLAWAGSLEVVAANQRLLLVFNCTALVSASGGVASVNASCSYTAHPLTASASQIAAEFNRLVAGLAATITAEHLASTLVHAPARPLGVGAAYAEGRLYSAPLVGPKLFENISVEYVAVEGGELVARSSWLEVWAPRGPILVSSGVVSLARQRLARGPGLCAAGLTGLSGDCSYSAEATIIWVAGGLDSMSIRYSYRAVASTTTLPAQLRREALLAWRCSLSPLLASENTTTLGWEPLAAAVALARMALAHANTTAASMAVTGYSRLAAATRSGAPAESTLGTTILLILTIAAAAWLITTLAELLASRGFKW